MKKKFPLLLVFISALFGFLAFFVYKKPIHDADQFLRNKFLLIIGVFAIILGLGSLIHYHIMKIRYKRQHWQYSWITLISMLVTTIIGIFGGLTGEGVLPTAIGNFHFDIQSLFTGIIVPLGSTMFALLAFFMCSAAYRAFRFRNLHAGVLMIAALIVMLGQIPLTTSWIPGIFELRQWILDVPNLASKRGIMIGVGLGVIATAFKIILGIERSWLGGGGSD